MAPWFHGAEAAHGLDGLHRQGCHEEMVLVMTDIAMEAMAHRNRWFIDGLPIKNGWIFHGYVKNNQMVVINTRNHDKPWLLKNVSSPMPKRTYRDCLKSNPKKW